MSDTERKTSWRVQVRYNGARSGAGQICNGVVNSDSAYGALAWGISEAGRGDSGIWITGFSVDEVQS